MDRRLGAYAVLLLVNATVNIFISGFLYSTTACGVHCDQVHPKYRIFNHPFILALLRCMGKFAFFIIYVIVHVVRSIVSTNQQPTVEPFLPCCQWFAMLPGAIANVMAILTNFLGLKLAPVAVFQLLRGTAVIFTGLLALVFLPQIIRRHQWLGMLTVALGATLIGSVDLIFYENHAKSQTNIRSIVAGSLLIALGQIVSSTESIVEQRYIRKYNINAMLAVGLEGLFGSIIIGTMLYPLHTMKVQFPLTQDPEGRLENVLDAFAMMGQNKQILLSLIGLVLSEATYSYVGLIIIKEYSAVTRAVLNCGKVTITFLHNSVMRRKAPNPGALALQLPGSLMNIVIGQLLYFDIILAPLWRECRGSRRSLQQYPIENEGQVDDPDTLNNSLYSEVTSVQSDNSVNETTRLLSNSQNNY